ncbi:MAG: serine/threonine-protein kinase [Candidatus Acidiferrales bacterium]
MKCFSCGGELPKNATFCPSCGTPVDISSTPTVTHIGSSPGMPLTSPEQRTKKTLVSSGHPSSSRRDQQGQFIAGATVAGRYRIVALLGKGGMGEVYRAEDLTLAQTVALKFLPVGLTQDEAARARFHQEVRLAREISHPNICRVFDIGEFDGRVFLSMEYVDGEDLASLLRRIGQLPQSKGLEIARQTCAGLAAAHEHGVLHRDLKPGNIMLDGRGRVRITDFGLAAFAEDLEAEELRAGTPAYMAPEQLAGTEVTARSDIYSLGLVFYEIFTGKKAFEAATMPELLRLREKNTLSSISTIVRDIDPLIERVILRCLEKDPAKRPATALQVAAALPGGDPLAAALAAGETPSPEMVAAAGEKEGMRPAIAWICLLLTIAGLAVIALLSNKINLPNLVPLPYSPDVLAARARDTLRHLGYSAPPTDTSYGFGNLKGYLEYVKMHDHSKSRWQNLATGVPPVITFWYRESPQFMVNSHFDLPAVVQPDNPPNSISGMCQIFLDTKGNLVGFEAVPPQFDSSAGAAPAPDWSQLFAAAGFDMKSFRSVSPHWTSLVTSDTRAAWEGAWPGHPELRLRVEAASYRGLPVYFELISPWTTPDRMKAQTSTLSDTLQNATLLTILFAILIFGILLAWRNLNSSRGDRRGAFRLALTVFLLAWTAALLFAHHIPTLEEMTILETSTGWALLAAGIVWILYIALEPQVRRRWPNSLISWSRLLSGQMKDPVVGRDLLVGTLTGTVWVIVIGALRSAAEWMGKTPLTPASSLDLVEFNGLRITVGDILLNVMLFIFASLAFFFIFFLLRLLLRKEWLAAVALVTLMTLPVLFAENPVSNAIASILIFGLALLILIRFGLLALVMALVLNNVLLAYPITGHLSAWYAEPTILVFVLIFALALFSFYTSTAGKPRFGAVSLDD